MSSLSITQWNRVQKKIKNFAAMDGAEIERNTLFRSERRCYDEVEPCRSRLTRKLPSFDQDQ
mgnify:CR=1 FL=1